MTNNTERLAVLEQKTDSIERKLDQHMADSRAFHTQILEKFENLDERYPTRREFKAANYVFGVAVTVIGVVLAVIKLKA